MSESVIHQRRKRGASPSFLINKEGERVNEASQMSQQTQPLCKLSRFRNITPFQAASAARGSTVNPKPVIQRVTSQDVQQL